MKSQKYYQKLNFIPKLTLPEPRKCVISITDECSMQCRMCYNWTLKDGNDVVNPAQWKHFVRDLALLKKKDMLLNIIGGEPLEKSWVLDIVREASNKGIRTSLTTNGFYIERTLFNKILDSGLSTLALSIDSTDPKVHDYYRGKKGAYKKAMEVIDFFQMSKDKAYLPELILQTIIMKRNIDDIPELVELAKRTDSVSGIYFMSVMKPHHLNLPDDWYLNDSRDIWPNDAEKVRRQLKYIISEKEKGEKIVNSAKHLSNFISYYEAPAKFIKKKSCNVMDFGIYIDSKGNASICQEKGVIGNIKKNSIYDIWYSYASIDVKKRMGKCQKNCEFLVNCFYEDEEGDE